MSVSVRGISSGIDINGIIEELMHLERQPIRRKEAMIERTEQIAELWREVNSRLDTLKRSLTPLLSELTFTAPVPSSSNAEVLTAKVSGKPQEGSYRFETLQLATRHSVATVPPTVGTRIINPTAAIGDHGTFHLGVGRQVEGLESLTFDSSTDNWLSGSVGAGLQAVVDPGRAEPYTLDLGSLDFAAGYEGADRIDVYMNSFTDADGRDIRSTLETYFSEKGWTVDLSEPLFTIEEDTPGAGDWVARAAHGGVFAFLGDHPLGTFNLRADIIDSDKPPAEQVLAYNNFNFEIRNSVDESKLITVKASDSLNTIADKVNAKSSYTGISARVIMAGSGDYRLMLESSVEGGNGFIQAYDYTPLDAAGKVKYGEDTVLANLFLVDGSASSAAGTVYRAGAETEKAEDALFMVNGLSMSRSSNTFKDVVDGLEITLTGTGKATLDVAPDIDAAVEEVRLFVESVNEVNSYLRILQEDKKGPLQGSSDLMRIERQLRTIVHGPVSEIPGSSHFSDPFTYSGGAPGSTGSATATGVYTGTATEMVITYYSSNDTWRYNGVAISSGETVEGLTINFGEGNPSNMANLILKVSPPTGPLAYNSLAAIGVMATDEEGFLAVDETKLREALAGDPESVFKLLAREAPRDAAGRARGAHGIVGQIQNMVDNLLGFNGLVQNRQSYLERQITQYERRIEMLERRMEVREARLVRQFTFMEQYIARIQEQTGLMASFELMMQQQQGNQ